MHLQQQIKSVYFFLIVWLFLPYLAFTQQNINDIKVTVTFESAPTFDTVYKAPLKYNKDFAFSMQIDDGHESIYTVGFPIFEGGDISGENYPGFTYTDGCGNDIQFKISTAQFSFNGNDENGIDTHIPGSEFGQVTWPQMDTLYKAGWGIYNHGVNGNASSDVEFMNYSLKRNKSYTRRNLINSTDGGVLTRVHVNPNGSIPWSQAAFDLGYEAAINQNGSSSFIGDNGGDVNSSSVDWSQPQNLFRRHNKDVNVQNYVGALADSSANGANYWGIIFTHSIGGEYPIEDFNSDFTNIESQFGSSGLDNILMSTDEEILDYLIISEAINVNTVIDGNKLEISFDGDIPNDLRFYATTLIINSDQNISNIVVTGTDSVTHSAFGSSEGIINLFWDGKVIIPAEVLADSMTTIAVNTQSQRDAWVAMDYVYSMQSGLHKDSLRSVLCSISNNTYDEDFCNLTIELGADTAICSNNCVNIYAPDGYNTYTWMVADTVFSTEQNLFVCPTETTEYVLEAVSNFGVSTGAMVVIVNDIPNIVSSSDSIITHIPGIDDTLWVSTQDSTLAYLWNNESADSSIVVDPEYTTEYYVDVISDSGCSTRQVFNVNVASTFDFTFNSVCYGDSTHLVNTSTYPDSVIRVTWDLNSDGVFDDDVGDTIIYKFPEAGNHLVGMKSVLYPAGIDLTFHVVAIGDNPIPNFEVNNVCIPSNTNFNDISTVIVGELINWYWDFGDGATDVSKSVEHSYSDPDQYDVKLIVKSSIGCEDSIIKQIEIAEPVNFVMLDSEGNTLYQNETSYITLGDSLYVTIENPNSYDSIIWDNEIKNSVYYVVNEGSYSVDVYTGPCGLSKERILAYSGGGSNTNEVMSLFTPNGDGYNDNWVVNDPNITAPFKVSIYNRYGNLVYESGDYQNDWHGTYNNTSLPQATYYYVIEDALGVIFKGPITILR